MHYKKITNIQGCNFTWKNMEFDNLGKQTWNL